MKVNSQLISGAIAGLVALGVVTATTTAFAKKDDTEKCAGIVKAGKNDCATSANACHGHVTSDANSEAWIYVPQGTCDRIVGGHIVKVQEPPPAK